MLAAPCSLDDEARVVTLPPPWAVTTSALLPTMTNLKARGCPVPPYLGQSHSFCLHPLPPAPPAHEVRGHPSTLFLNCSRGERIYRTATMVHWWGRDCPLEPSRVRAPSVTSSNQSASSYIHNTKYPRILRVDLKKRGMGMAWNMA